MEPDQGPAIPQLVATAQRLRSVRAACRQFFALWALEQAAGRTALADHGGERANRKTDWFVLYRGDILDD